MKLESHLAPRPANFQPLTPISFLERAIDLFPDRKAIVWRHESWTYMQLGQMVSRLVQVLSAQSVTKGDVVSIICPNRPEMIAAHFAVPMVGAVLNTINTRLDTATVAKILTHAGSKICIVDGTCEAPAREAAHVAGVPLLRLDDGNDGEGVFLLGELKGEATGISGYRKAIDSEWQALCLNYTSGTTGDQKGVVYHHRGAYLNSLGNVIALGLERSSVYLWTLPMFHCNGWCHVWAVTAVAGTHVCLDRVDPSIIFKAIDQNHVTHMSCAPVVLYMMLNHVEGVTRQGSPRVRVATGGASPTSTLISKLEALGFDLTHLYGLTESFGPATMCELDEKDAAADLETKARMLARQGGQHVTSGVMRVVDERGVETPRDGHTIGEIVLEGNTLMAGYYRNADATEEAFREGCFHTGDLAVRHASGQIEIRDRSKDIIISGGENISSLEVENVLHKHPAVLMAAVVALADPKWGEIPCAFVELKQGADVEAEELERFCREGLAAFKVPRRFQFGELPKTATGKIQKFLLRQEAQRRFTGQQG